MKRHFIKPLIAILLIGIVLISCKKDEVYNSYPQLIKNGNADSGTLEPDNWYRSPDQHSFSLKWSDSEYYSPEKSLSISNSVLQPSNFVYWSQTYSGNIPHGFDVMLKVRIKSDLMGEGVALAIRGDDTDTTSGSAEQFSTSEDYLFITGTNGWSEKVWILRNVQESVKSLTVYLIYLPNTSGDVWFDDVELSVLY